MAQARITSAAGQPEVVSHKLWPRYLVDSPSFFAAEPRLLTKNTSIADHSESFFVESALLMNSAHLTITLP